MPVVKLHALLPAMGSTSAPVTPVLLVLMWSGAAPGATGAQWPRPE